MECHGFELAADALRPYDDFVSCPPRFIQSDVLLSQTIMHHISEAISVTPLHLLATQSVLPDGGFNWPLLWVLLLLGAAVAMFVSNKPGMDVVALLMIAALPFTGVLTVQETLAGFSDPNIVLIAFLFVLGEGLVRTGVARQLGDWINLKAAGRETKLLLLLMASVAGLGSVMSSTAIVAIFIPVVFRICRNSGIPASRLMMPVSFAALISGMMTLISTTPNLVVNAELVRQGADGFHFFSVTPFGLVILALGLAYMKFARKWIPERNDSGSSLPERPSFQSWIDKYQLAAREMRVRVLPGSNLIGKTLEELDLRHSGVNLLAVERVRDRRRTLLRPGRTFCPQADDVMFLDVTLDKETCAELIRKCGVEELPLDPENAYFRDLSQDLGMSEAIIPADSGLVGRTIRDSRLRADSGLTVIGLRRASEAITSGFVDEKLRVGDTLLVTGFWKDIQRMQRDNRQLVLLDMPAEFEDVLPAADKGPIALAILALVILTMISGLIPNVHAVLIGCLLMGLFGVMTMKAAYRSVSWKSLVLIVGMLPFSLALQRTGGTDLAANGILGVIGEGSPRLALAVVFAVTAILGLFISNTATAVLMAPVAFAIADDMDASPYPFAMIVMLAASAAFMTPVSSPVNTLVVSPGNYRFGDFVRVGVPFTILVMITAIVMVPIFLPP
jgi:di/tricarboxylate transporter